MSSTADIIYIYKDGPEFPDSELTGEQQLAEQRAYVESFAKFEEEEANDGKDGDEHASDSGTEDFALSDDGHLFAEAPTAREPETGPRTSRFLEEIVAEERRDDFMSKVHEKDKTASADSNMPWRLKQDKEKGVSLYIWTEDRTSFALPDHWDYTMECIENNRTQETVDGIMRKLLKPAFAQYQQDVEALMVEVAQGEKAGGKATVEDEENFLSWLEQHGRCKSWIAITALLTRISNHLSVYGPPPLTSENGPRLAFGGEGGFHKPGDRALVGQRALGALVNLYHYFSSRAGTLMSQISNEMMDGEDSHGRRLRLVAEITQMRKDLESSERKAKRNIAKREKAKSPRPVQPVTKDASLPAKAKEESKPPRKFRPVTRDWRSPAPDSETPEERLARYKARKLELENAVWAQFGTDDREESFDDWLRGDTK